LLETLSKIEKRGALEAARRLRQTCGQVFRYAIVTQRATHDPSGDLRGALGSPGRKRGHKAMAREELPKFLSALEVYDGDLRTGIALQLINSHFCWHKRAPSSALVGI
jgi:integrase